MGQRFAQEVVEFWDALSKYSIDSGLDFDFVKNDKDRVTVHCKRRVDLGCLWSVHARLKNSSKAFVIKQFDDVHSCGSSFRIVKHARMTSSIIGGLISSERAWMGVGKARGAVFGDYSLSFDDLRWYVDAANDANLGSVFDMEFDVDSKRRYFKRLFFAFEACIHGFKYCQPLLMLDGTFLKGGHKGCLLDATAKDGKSYGEMCTNAVESFNLWIRDDRHLFLTSLVDVVRVKLMEQFSNRREVGNKWNRIVCPFAEKKLEETFNDIKAWIVKKCNDDIYEIQLDHSVMVDIGKCFCSCRLWEIYSFLCKHGFCAIKRSGKDLNCFLDNYYHVRSYCDLYLHPIYPVPNM
ncbi:hypothetical protein ACSBR2_004493 [Camellia fascicularis]